MSDLKAAALGVCWSCDAPNSPAYHCERGHEWFCCEETCGQTVEANGVVDWDHCHECQEQADFDEKNRARYEPDPDMDDAGESGERIGMRYQQPCTLEGEDRS